MNDTTTTTTRECVFCGGEVTSTNAETDFCRDCFYSGHHLERRFEDLIGLIGDIEEVNTCAVWHTGGGCFNLAVALADGRLLTPSVGLELGDELGITVEPGFPDPEDGDRWGMVVSESQEAWEEWDESRLYVPQRLWTTDELPNAIREIATETERRV